MLESCEQIDSQMEWLVVGGSNWALQEGEEASEEELASGRRKAWEGEEASEGQDPGKPENLESVMTRKA